MERCDEINTLAESTAEEDEKKDLFIKLLGGDENAPKVFELSMFLIDKAAKQINEELGVSYFGALASLQASAELIAKELLQGLSSHNKEQD